MRFPLLKILITGGVGCGSLAVGCLISFSFLLALRPCGSVDVALRHSGCVRKIRGDGSFVSGVAISPDNRLVAAKLWDQVRVWRISDGEMLDGLAAENDGAAWCMGFSSDGQTLVSGCTGTFPDDYYVRIWDVTTGTHLHTILQADTRDIAFSPDGRLLAAVSDRSLFFWQLADGTPLQRYDVFGEAYRLALSPDGQKVAVASSAGHSYQLQIWQIETAKLLHSMLSAERIEGMVFSPDCETLIAGTESATVQWWSTRDGTSLRILRLPMSDARRRDMRQTAFSPSGEMWAIARSQRIDLWSIVDGTLQASLPINSGRTHGLAFSPDGELLVVGTAFDIEVWKKP